ncbi:MAG: type 1 glutamine amidotransferase [Bdellovibrionales bacterium]|nr:type 1 glutamine amidotransferase [Bdellovibrionales bacterium]
MRVLIVDNNIRPRHWGSADLVRSVNQASPGAVIAVRRGPQGDLPPEPAAFDRVVLSGSMTSCMDLAPWTLQLEDFIRRALDREVPVLGVCYGHQILARALGGRDAVGKSERSEHGWTQIRLDGRCELTRGLKDRFWSFSAHNEEVKRLPPGAVARGSSEACKLQVIEYPGKRSYGIQFHPERDAGEAETTFAEMRKEGRGSELLRARETKKLHDPAVCTTIFSNFLGQGPVS